MYWARKKFWTPHLVTMVTGCYCGKGREAYIANKKIRCNSKARQAIYVSRYLGAPSCNRCCNGKAINITYSECVFVALGIQHAMCKPHIVIWGLSGCTIVLPHYFIKKHDFRKKKLLKTKVCIYFSRTIGWNSSHSKKNWARYDQKCMLVFM